MAQPLPSIANERTGWFVVLVASVFVGMSYGTLLSVTVFLKPLEAEFSWLRADTSFAYMAAHVMAGVGGVLTGLWADRWSTRSVVLVGSLTIGIFYVMLALMQSLLEFYIIFGVFMGGFSISAFLGPLMTSVGFWFDKNRGLAMSLTLSGQSVGGAGLPLLAGYMMESMSWRDAYLSLGLLTWVVMIPLSFLLRDPPGLKAFKAASQARMAAHTADERPVIIRPGRLLFIMSLAGGAVAVCLTVPLVHLVPLVTSYGFDAKTAGSVFGVILFASIPGRLLLGKLADSIGGLRTMLLAAIFPVFSIYGFVLFHSLPGLYAVAAVFGFGFGGVLPSLGLIIRELVPAHLAARSMGVLLLSGYGALGAGGYMGGVLFDLTGGYTTTYAAGTLSGILGLVLTGALTLFITRRKARMAAPQPA